MQIREEKELNSSKNRVLIRGAKGAVKELNYDYVSSKGEILNKSVKNKDSIERKLKLFKELGIEVNEIKQ